MFPTDGAYLFERRTSLSSIMTVANFSSISAVLSFSTASNLATISNLNLGFFPYVPDLERLVEPLHREHLERLLGS
jgi:hypothetical protein